MSQITQFFRSKLIILVMIAITSILIVACSSPDETPTEQPTSQPEQAQAEGVLTSRPPVGLDPTATVPAPTYREPSQPITLETVSQIDYLGRLNTEGARSTIFNWAISPDGIQLTGLNNDLLTEWNLVTGQINFSTPRNNITQVLYSADRNEIYGISSDGTVRIYESITGAPQTQLEIHPTYNSLYTYDVGNGILAVAGEDGTVKVWDMQERVSLTTFDVQTEQVVDIELSSDGQLLATTGTEGTIKLWAWESESEIAEYDLQSAVAQDMVFSPDDARLAIATQNFVAVWDVLTGELDYVLQSGTNTANRVLKFSPDGQYLATAGDTGNMRLWNAETSDMAIELPDIGGNRVSGAFSLDTTLLATTVLGQEASLWNIADITEETVGRAPLDIPSQNLFGVEWSSDGFTLLFFDATGDIFVWGIPPLD